MIDIPRPQFEAIVSEAIDTIPQQYMQRLQNVAFIVEDEPTLEQRSKLGLSSGQLLYGLYEGVPLPQRGGVTHNMMLPDKITLFRQHIARHASTLDDAKALVKNTVWHEVAHFFGLDHLRIHELETGR